MPSIINTTYPQYGVGSDFADAMYKQTLAGYQQREQQYQGNTANNIAGYERLYNTQGQYGASERARIGMDAARQQDASQQSMISRGLGNTTALDSAARGINYDTQNQYMTLNDQLLQRQNQIAGNELQYQGQAQQGLAGLQGERLGWMGNVQGNTQAQNFQGATQQEQFAQQQALNKQQFGYQQQASQQGFGQQYALAQQSLGNQQVLQREFGFYNSGGSVMPPPSGTDVIPARLSPGEFVLSTDMIDALEKGRLDSGRLVNMIRQQRAGAIPATNFAHGGYVSPMTLQQQAEQRQAARNTVPTGTLHTTSTMYNDQPVDALYQRRGQYG